jgi:hypothetical protein
MLQQAFQSAKGLEHYQIASEALSFVFLDLSLHLPVLDQRRSSSNRRTCHSASSFSPICPRFFFANPSFSAGLVIYPSL